jgi:transcriptional regulator with XRE-family HTH domain
MAGRPQESARTGATYQLAEFLNRNWDEKVGRTNEDVAQELGYRAANMISMWRTGRTRVPLEKLPDIARLMKVDIALLLPMWLEQQWGDRADGGNMRAIFDRFGTAREGQLLAALRTAIPGDPLLTPAVIAAMVAVAHDKTARAGVTKMIAGRPA